MAHNFGFDSFMKIAHMARGHYLFLDIRGAPRSANGGGLSLGGDVVQDLAQLGMALWRYSTSPGVLTTVSRRTSYEVQLVTPEEVQHSQLTPEEVRNQMYADEVVLDMGKGVFHGGASAVSLIQDLGLAAKLMPTSRAYAPPRESTGLRREYWIFRHPAATSSEVQAIFGPSLSSNYAHCIRLPYFKVQYALP